MEEINPKLFYQLSRIEFEIFKENGRSRSGKSKKKNEQEYERERKVIVSKREPRRRRINVLAINTVETRPEICYFMVIYLRYQEIEIV